MVSYIKKISHSIGRNNNFLAKAQKLSTLPTSLDIFYIRHHYVRKVVGGFGKKSCVSTGVRKPGNTCASSTAMI